MLGSRDPATLSHEELYKFSIEKPQEFWKHIANSEVEWAQPFQQTMDCDMIEAKFQWFLGGTLNASVNCVDRHARANPNKVALIWEKDEPGQEVRVTYQELQDMTSQIGNLLLDQGIKKGDIVAIYMPVSPLAVASMLACSRIGAIHSVIFAGFSSKAIASRVQDMQATAIITANESVRGGKTVPLRKTVQDALNEGLPSIKKVFVMKRTENLEDLAPTDIILDDAIKSFSTHCPAEIMNAEDPLFILYTSGSTGKPKGLSHSTAGYLTYAGFTQKQAFSYFDNNDVFGCVADIGWITGHTYVVYGTLMNGGTSVLFESSPTYPDPGRYWETVERLKINQFYGSPTAIRLLIKYGDEWVKKYDRSSLKTLGSVGEPLNHEAWHWFHDLVGEGRCDLVDSWWQTETGGIAIAPRPSAQGASIVPAKPMRPMFGMNPVLLDDKANELMGNDQSGALCLKTPWPGMARTVVGDHERFKQAYFTTYPGYYFTGDGAYRDKDGYYQITGRMDDVINVTGHRLGTAEVEDVLTDHPMVAEAAVVGFPHEIKGEGVYAYVILKLVDGEKLTEAQNSKIINELRQSVKKNISGFAVPEKLQICSGLPKTRSGKIMRRILRKVAANLPEELGDVSTLADPSVVDEIVANHIKLKL